MAETVLTNMRVEANSVVLSDRSNEVTINMGKEMKDKSTFGGTNRLNKPGLGTIEVQVKFLEDYATSEVNQTLYPLYLAGTAAVWKFRPDSGTITATNPEYSGTFVISSYPQGGTHGELHETTLTLALETDDWAKATS